MNILKMLRPKDVADRLGISTTTIWRLERAGKFPSRKRIGLRSVGWPEQAIDNYLNEQPSGISAKKGNPKE